MYDRWSLDVFYKGADDPAIEADMEALKNLNAEYRSAVTNAHTGQPAEALKSIILLKEEILNVTNRLYVFFRLRRSGSGPDKECDHYRVRIQKLTSENAKEDVLFKKFVGSIADLDGVIASDPLLEEHSFYLNDLKNSLKHSLSEEGEYVLSKMNDSGGAAWTEHLEGGD